MLNLAWVVMFTQFTQNPGGLSEWSNCLTYPFQRGILFMLNLVSPLSGILQLWAVITRNYFERSLWAVWMIFSLLLCLIFLLLCLMFLSLIPLLFPLTSFIRSLYFKKEKKTLLPSSSPVPIICWEEEIKKKHSQQSYLALFLFSPHLLLPHQTLTPTPSLSV